jgi:hypothetical protein
MFHFEITYPRQRFVLNPRQESIYYVNEQFLFLHEHYKISPKEKNGKSKEKILLDNLFLLTRDISI